MFSSETGMWATPQSFFDSVNEIYNFSLDVCATSENTKCVNYFSPDVDGLSQKWSGVCWMNPPYGRGISKWIKKASDETTKGNCIVVALLPARTDTKWFHNYIYKKDSISIEFIKGRLKFGGAKNAAPFPSMLVIFNKTLKS